VLETIVEAEGSKPMAGPQATARAGMFSPGNQSSESGCTYRVAVGGSTPALSAG